MTDTAIVPASTPAGLDTLAPDARARVASAVADARAANTRRTYAGQWQRFADWTAERQVSSLPATAATVADYLTDRATAAKTATVRLNAAAIGAAHRGSGAPDPTATPIVRAALRGIARQHAAHPDAAPRQAAALTYDDAIRLMATAERPQRKKRRGSPPGGGDRAGPRSGGWRGRVGASRSARTDTGKLLAVRG